MRAIAIAFALLFAATLARAGDLPSAAPAEVGLSAERLNRITQCCGRMRRRGPSRAR